ncbi:hypothetical protein OK016_08165 [Vibrio chagasii]|nr:hypothetical protein [Vibrio chagasii]
MSHRVFISDFLDFSLYVMQTTKSKGGTNRFMKPEQASILPKPPLTLVIATKLSNQAALIKQKGS